MVALRKVLSVQTSCDVVFVVTKTTVLFVCDLSLPADAHDPSETLPLKSEICPCIF